MSTIHYHVHPTPQRPGEEEQTYHVRQVMKSTVRTRELAEHIAHHGLISVGVFEMVMERLKKEMAEHLLSGRDLHLDGIGRFSLQIGTRRTKGDDGQWHRKVYHDPDELTARELTIEGITFVPDKAMLDLLHEGKPTFVREKEDYEQDVPRGQLLKTLADHCRQYGSFTRQTVQALFGLSRYRAQKLLDDLVSEPYAKFYREKQGPTYVYRKTGT